MAEQQYDWTAIANHPKFKEIHHRKSNFLIGWWVFSSIFYFALPLAAGFTTEQTSFFNQKIIGVMPLLYIFALAQYALCIGIALYYAHWANKISDRLTAELLQDLNLK